MYTTENGDLRSGLDGGIRLTITVRGFSIICSSSEIVVNFGIRAGTRRVDVTRLRYSTFYETRFGIIVPVPRSAENVPSIVAFTRARRARMHTHTYTVARLCTHVSKTCSYGFTEYCSKYKLNQ